MKSFQRLCPITNRSPRERKPWAGEKKKVQIFTPEEEALNQQQAQKAQETQPKQAELSLNHTLFYTRLADLCDNVYKYHAMSRIVPIEKIRKSPRGPNPFLISRNENLRENQYKGEPFTPASLSIHTGTLMNNQRFKKSDARLQSVIPIRKTSNHQFWGEVMNLPDSASKRTPYKRSQSTVPAVALSFRAQRESSTELKSNPVRKGTQQSFASTLQPLINTPPISPTKVETSSMREKPALSIRTKMSRQEVYDAIMLGQSVTDEQVFQTVVTYSPFGERKIVPATDELLKAWYKNQQIASEMNIQENRRNFNDLKYVVKPSKIIIEESQIHTTPKNKQSSDSIKTDQDLFKISSLDDDLSLSDNTDSVSHSKKTKGGNRDSSNLPSRQTSWHKKSSKELDLEKEFELQQQQYLKTTQNFTVQSIPGFDDSGLKTTSGQSRQLTIASTQEKTIIPHSSNSAWFHDYVGNLSEALRSRRQSRNKNSPVNLSALLKEPSLGEDRPSKAFAAWPRENSTLMKPIGSPRQSPSSSFHSKRNTTFLEKIESSRISPRKSPEREKTSPYRKNRNPKIRLQERTWKMKHRSLAPVQGIDDI